MKHFEFNDKKYSLPESWKEVTFKQLKEIKKAAREEDSTLLRAARFVSILSGLDYDVLINCESTLTLELIGRIPFLLDETVEGSVQHFKIGGDTFYVNDLTNSVWKEFATFEIIDQKFPEDPEQAMALKLAVLCRKEGETFLQIEKDLEKRADLFDLLDAETVFKINGFFLLNKQLSDLSFQASLQLLKERQDSEQLLERLLTKSTVGLPWLSGWRLRLNSWLLSTLSKLKTS